MDDEGHELGSGVMELTQRELILHTHKRDAVRWPYLCLRRYGFDSNLFSFESGRRCHTGQGQSLGGLPGGGSAEISLPKGSWSPCLPEFLALRVSAASSPGVLVHTRGGCCGLKGLNWV